MTKIMLPQILVLSAFFNVNLVSAQQSDIASSSYMKKVDEILELSKYCEIDRQSENCNLSKSMAAELIDIIKKSEKKQPTFEEQFIVISLHSILLKHR